MTAEEFENEIVKLITDAREAGLDFDSIISALEVQLDCTRDAKRCEEE